MAKNSRTRLLKDIGTFWTWISLSISLLIIIEIVIVFTLLGENVTLIHLTDYGVYLYLGLSIAIPIMLFFSWISINGFKSKKKGISPNHLWISKLAGVFMIIILLVADIGMITAYSMLTKGGNPSARDNYNYEAGPFISFGPLDSDRFAGSTNATMAMWWFEPTVTHTSRNVTYWAVSEPGNKKNITEQPSGDGQRHQVYFEELSTSTTYIYTIPGLNDGGKEYNFTTGPEVGVKTDFRFFSTGDTRNSGGDGFCYYGDINYAIDKFYENEGEKPAFEINLGDIVSTGTDLESWKVFYDDIKTHAPTYPLMISIGNHELGGDLGVNYQYFMDYPVYYSFDYGNAHFLMMNVFDGIIGNIAGAKQIKWIREDLEANKDKKWLIVSGHIPLLSQERNVYDYIEQCFELFREMHVDVVLTGHDHHYDSYIVNDTAEDKSFNGTYYFVNGGGGATLDSYLLEENGGKWDNWYSDEPFLDDELSEKYHQYSELSWGFMDLSITGDTLNISYYRWLDFQRFLDITGQTHNDWSMQEFTPEEWATNNLDDVVLVDSFEKIRIFS